MKAKCPHCEGGCGKCSDGFIDISLPEEFVSMVCPACGAEVGGQATGEGFPALPTKPSRYAICPYCNVGGLVWGRKLRNPSS